MVGYLQEEEWYIPMFLGEDCNVPFLPPNEGISIVHSSPKPEVKNSHTPPEAAGRGWSMGIVYQGFGKE